MPAVDNHVSKYIMLTMEICRVHMYTRKEDPVKKDDDPKRKQEPVDEKKLVFLQNDYRNAHRVIMHMLKLFPKNPYAIYKAGKFFLEVGNKVDAQVQFSKLRSMLQEATKQL